MLRKQPKVEPLASLSLVEGSRVQVEPIDIDVGFWQVVVRGQIRKSRRR